MVLTSGMMKSPEQLVTDYNCFSVIIALIHHRLPTVCIDQQTKRNYASCASSSSYLDSKDDNLGLWFVDYGWRDNVVPLGCKVIRLGWQRFYSHQTQFLSSLGGYQQLAINKRVKTTKCKYYYAPTGIFVLSVGNQKIFSLTIVSTYCQHVLSGSFRDLQPSTPLVSHCHILQRWYKQLGADVSGASCPWSQGQQHLPQYGVCLQHKKYKDSYTVNRTKLHCYVKYISGQHGVTIVLLCAERGHCCDIHVV